MKWFWNFLAISGILYGVLGLAFVFLPPFQLVTEALVCSDDEHLVTETRVTRGASTGSETHGCCAKKTDTREFGKCDWSESLNRDSLTLLVPLGFAFVGGTIGGALITLALRRAFARGKRA